MTRVNQIYTLMNTLNINKIKHIKVMEKVHVYMCLHLASVKFTALNKIKLFPTLLLISTSWFFILAEGFRNDHLAACSTALRSATEKNEMNDYVTVPCSSKMTQHSSIEDWTKFY